MCLVLGLSLLFSAGCGSKDDAPTTFKASKAELAEAEKMPQKYALGSINFRYPADWKDGPQMGGINFIIFKEGANDKFRTNLNLIKQVSDPTFEKMQVEEMKKAITQQLASMKMDSSTFDIHTSLQVSLMK